MKTEIQETELYKKFIKALNIQDMRADDNPFVVACCKIAADYANQLKSQPIVEGETVYRIHSVVSGLPNDGKGHYYILKDGTFYPKLKYAIHIEQIKIIENECEYWLEEATLPLSVNMLSDEEIIKAFCEIYTTSDKDECSIGDIMTRCINWLNHYSKITSSKGIDANKLMEWIVELQNKYKTKFAKEIIEVVKLKLQSLISDVDSPAQEEEKKCEDCGEPLTGGYEVKCGKCWIKKSKSEKPF